MSFARLKKAGKNSITVILVFVLAINLLTMAFSVLGLREYLNWMPLALLEVKSGSMEPAISAGDALLVLETPYDELAVGDIVTFHRGDEFVSHQIIGEKNNYFITKGTANNYQDNPIGPEEYCAKVIRVLPGVGGLLNFLSTPAEMLLLAVLLFVLMYGRPILNSFYDKVKKKRAKTAEPPSPGMIRRTGVRRLLALLAAISIVSVTPFITVAKYTARINAYTAISAASVNFASNYLSEGGNTYFVDGWNGISYCMNLRIKNYSNDLLMNMEDQDLYYGMCVVPVASEGSETYAEYGEAADYTVSVTPTDASVLPLTDPSTPYSFPADWPTQNQYGPYMLIGSNDIKLEHAFNVNVLSSGAGLAANDKVRFKILACTSEQDQFFMELLGDFTFQAAESTDFIAETQLCQYPNMPLVTFLLRTNLIDNGSATKNIQFTWNTEKLYINEFESAAYNIIMNRPGNYNKANGTLIMPLQAFSSVTLQFFKINSADNIDSGDLTAAVIT
ncbi:MAG: signal peptidase I [Clostridia bacterium]|nr:signal peptidase I [Clostridia bacterium]